MLTDTVKNLLARRQAESKVIRVPVCSKAYQAFVMEKINEKLQRQARKENLAMRIEKLNKLVNDVTFKFIIWDYDIFYSVQVFEGHEIEGKTCVLEGKVNTDYSDDDNLYIQRPMFRKRFKSLNGVEAYIVWYYNNHIKPDLALVTNVNIEIALEITFVTVAEAKFKESRAVIFDIDMMAFWEKHKLLPPIKQIYNGKRYNRSTHAKKIINSLKQGKIVKEEQHYIIYWGV